MFVEIRVGDSDPASNNKSDKIIVVESDSYLDPHVFGLCGCGSGSTSQWYGSTSGSCF
jgi:hypothetical protein